ncbi:hypothetical protein [Microbacterium allomyrinae]|jgi:hypothetical protein|uniref:Uncharacterized protein n=1 Tax=Microbacterium allomyrinae TaxID=2830666 RepID=A0A9X1S3Z2_9MICO|nr:hypothetical protein [Microbacterium allomyrinae]MCC2032460.1 hypothetical protein [Microbacterium allomyrinae]
MREYIENVTIALADAVRRAGEREPRRRRPRVARATYVPVRHDSLSRFAH